MSTVNTFATLSADGSTADLNLPGDVNSVKLYLADGETWGGGTLTMYQSFDGGTTYVAVASSAKTSGDGYLGTFDVYGRVLKFILASSTTPTLDITVVADAVASSAEVVQFIDDGSADFSVPRKGDFAVFAAGTWDSGSLTISETPDNTLYTDIGYTAVTADGGAVFVNAQKNDSFRLVLASVATACVLQVTILRKVDV
jgi:hypothetical protein